MWWKQYTDLRNSINPKDKQKQNHTKCHLNKVAEKQWLKKILKAAQKKKHITHSETNIRDHNKVLVRNYANKIIE